MIWQNPIALIGLLALAVPLLVHLLARRTARVQPFPTLRFLHATRLLAPRRTRISDVLLLLLRLVIIALAVGALAQPWFLTGARERALGRTLARAIIVDTSASMMRAVEGGRALDHAREDARLLAAEGQTSVIMESATPARALSGALAWLERQPGRREIVIVSDFQTGTLEVSDLSKVPADIGTRFLLVPIRASDAPIESVVRRGERETVARITLPDDRTTRVEWTARSRAQPAGGAVTLLTAASDSAQAQAALSAASAFAGPTADTTRAVAIVYPGYAQRTALLRDARPPSDAWMGDVIARLRANPTFERGGRGTVNGREWLLVFARAEPASLASATLIAETQNALADHPAPASELDPTTLPNAVLRQWERAPVPVARRGADGNGASDGRWLWLLALLLLGLESFLRRPGVARKLEPGTVSAAPEPARERTGDQRVA